MKNKWGLLTSIAIGDAMGAPFEFGTRDMLKKFNVDKYPNNVGTYTDDTQMSIAVALHTYANFDYTTGDYASHFWGQYLNDKNRPGFSRRTRAALEEDTLDGCIRSCASQMPRDTNGCVMRVLPLGYITNTEHLKQAALIQCVVTHPLLECIIAAQFVALMAHYYIYRSNDTDLCDFMKDQLGAESYGKVAFAWDGESEIPCNAIKTAGFCFDNMKGKSMKAILKRAIKVGGDVDSLAAICMGLASLNKKVENDLSDALYNDLENGEFGRDFLDSLSSKLDSRFSN